MKFKEYIETRQVRDNEQGDFVLEARADLALPDVQTWSELRSHLERKGASIETIQIGHSVWKAYQSKARKRQRALKGAKSEAHRRGANGTPKLIQNAEGGGKIKKVNVEGKSIAAVALGRRGGEARARVLSAERRKEIAQIAAAKRWGLSE